MPADLDFHGFTCREDRHVFDVAEDGQSAACECGAQTMTPTLPPPWADQVADLVCPSNWRGDLDPWGDGIPTDYRAGGRVNEDAGPDCGWSFASDHLELTVDDDDLTLSVFVGDEDDVPKHMRALLAAAITFLKTRFDDAH